MLDVDNEYDARSRFGKKMESPGPRALHVCGAVGITNFADAMVLKPQSRLAAITANPNNSGVVAMCLVRVGMMAEGRGAPYCTFNSAGFERGMWPGRGFPLIA